MLVRLAALVVLSFSFAVLPYAVKAQSDFGEGLTDLLKAERIAMASLSDKRLDALSSPRRSRASTRGVASPDA